MRSRVRLFVLGLSTIGALATAAVYLAEPLASWELLRAALCFAALGAMSGLLAYKKVGRSESGSIAFLPLLAAIIVAPVWTTVITTAAAMALVEIINRRATIKAIFNVMQSVLAVSVAILVYRGIGGKSLLGDVRIDTVAFVAALTVFVLSNTAALNGVISAAEGKSFISLWRQHARTTLLYDVYALPFVYVFAWFYVEFGVWGAVGLVIPLLGVRELYKNNWELQKTNQELLQLMVAAIEARDPYTSGHSLRVSQNARLIAETLGIGDKAIDRIAIAALLHDVGKIHEVFGPILSKPGRLTAEENAIMRTHPVKSEELVATVSRLKDLLKPIRHHHENWDGTGYPDGLMGDEIPLTARIIMFADTVDAMTTDRPYRPALSESAVRDELLRYRGSQFDPHICDVLLESGLLPRLVARAHSDQKAAFSHVSADIAQSAILA